MGYLDTLGRVMKGDYGSATAEQRAAATHEVIQVCAVAAAAVTIQPFPVADVFLLSPIQIAMVQAIGRIHGRSIDKKTVLEILSTVGASIVAQNVIMAAAKLIPVLGSVVAMSMGYALTYALGEVSDLYFKSGDTLSSSELKKHFRSIYQTKKNEKEHAARDPKLNDKLDLLKKAFDAGVLSKAEFDLKKEEVLKGF